MSRAYQIDRHVEREEDRLSREYNSGEISLADYNEAMLELQREARDAYQQDLDEAAEYVRDEWGW